MNFMTNELIALKSIMAHKPELHTKKIKSDGPLLTLYTKQTPVADKS